MYFHIYSKLYTNDIDTTQVGFTIDLFITNTGNGFIAILNVVVYRRYTKNLVKGELILSFLTKWY